MAWGSQGNCLRLMLTLRLKEVLYRVFQGDVPGSCCLCHPSRSMGRDASLDTLDAGNGQESAVQGLGTPCPAQSMAESHIHLCLCDRRDIVAQGLFNPWCLRLKYPDGEKDHWPTRIKTFGLDGANPTIRQRGETLPVSNLQNSGGTL